MRRLLIVVLLVLVLTALLATAAGAREILGCHGMLQWPCPGPAL